MLQQKVLQYLEQIQTKIDQNSSSHTLIPLFYNLIKIVDHSHSSSRRFNSSTKTDSNCYFETRSKFSAFLEKNQKQNQKLTAQDKIMAYMLKASSQMISSLNYRVKTTMYNKCVGQSELTDCTNYTRYKSLDVENDILSADSLSIKSHFLNQNIQLQSQSQIIQSPKKLKNRNKKINALKSSKMRQIDLASINEINSQKFIEVEVQNNAQVQGNPQSQIQVLWRKVMTLYEEHRLDQAYAQLQQYKKMMKTKSTPAPNLNSQTSPLTIQQIQTEYQQMKTYHDYFNIESYTFDKKEDGMTMHYKILQKQNLIAVHIEGQFDIPIEKFLCIANQIQLYPSYVPFNYETKLLKNLGRNRKIGVSRVYLPFISNRQAYFHAAAYDRLKSSNSIFMYSKSLLRKEASQKYQYQIPKSDMVSLDYKFFMLEYTPISKNKGKIKMSSCVDMNLEFIPKFILNKTARIFAFDYFKNMIKVNKKFKGSEWEKALIEKPQIYGFFKNKIDQYFKNTRLTSN